MPAKPKPAILKLIEGRGNGRDSGGREVKPIPGFVRLPPAKPAWLVDEAAELWDQVVAELQRLQILKPIDGAALTAYCLTWQRMCQAERLVVRDGLVLETERGPVKNPAALILEAASKELRAWSNEFGLTPSSESRVARPPAEGDGDDNPFA